MMFSKSGISFSQGAPIFRCFCCYFQGGEWLPDVTLDMGDGQLIFDPSSFGFVPKDSIPPETGCDSWVFWKNTIPQIWGKRNGLFQMGFSRFSLFFSLVANCWGIFGSHQNSWDFWFVSFFRISLKNGRNPQNDRWWLPESKNWCFIPTHARLGGKNWGVFTKNLLMIQHCSAWTRPQTKLVNYIQWIVLYPTVTILISDWLITRQRCARNVREPTVINCNEVGS